MPGGYAAREDVQVLAVCDVRRERREGALERCNQVYAQRFGQGKYEAVAAYNDFREVLARPDIDAVPIALPHHWAGKMAAMARILRFDFPHPARSRSRQRWNALRSRLVWRRAAVRGSGRLPLMRRPSA